MNTHQKYMQRCLQIAKNAKGLSMPNPMVGAVIVYNNCIIGEGFTSCYGANHAEVNAINQVKNKTQLQKATLYVTLEPCSHHGKTPPCCDLIRYHNIPRVIVGCLDDNPKVAGQGLKKLRNSGCEVTVGVLEQACKAHHKHFFTFINKKRPYIILKWAETENGFIAPKQKNETKPVWISNTLSRQITHKWRSEIQSILVGTTTIKADNPSLTVRNWTGKQPLRVAIDKTNALKKTHHIFNADSETLIISENNVDFNQPLAKQICAILYAKHISTILIEGGKKTLETFINEGLWDEIRQFISPITFKQGIQAPKYSGKLISKHVFHNDLLKIYTHD